MCALLTILDLSSCSVLREHEGLGPEVIEVSGNVSSEDNTRN